VNAEPIVRVENLSYRYPHPAENRGLSVDALQVEAGETILLTGPSGCGKSTLARCLTGLIPHLYRGERDGRVIVDGLDAAGVPLWQVTERAGMVFQNPASQMLAASVEDEIVFGLENLGLPRAEIGSRLEAALACFGLDEMRSRGPLTLSGGEQQRLALAAISARQPPVLVLDEPLSMLDSTAVEGLVSHLAELARSDTTVIVCEHRVAPLRRIPGARTVCLAQDEACAERRPAPGGPTLERVGRFVLEVSHLEVDLGERTVLRDTSFSAAGGEVVAIVGRNGVGKTTLLRALAGLQRYRGTVSVDGERPDLAMVFQNPDMQLFNATVRDEILFKVPEPDMSWYRWLLDMLGLGDYKETPPLLLSEGEKKRVALAIALMHKPAHGVLLDEPALGQDAAHKARLIGLARALAEAGRLVVMTTHDLSLAAQADRLLLLGESGLIADGSPPDVLRQAKAWAEAGLVVPGWALEHG
jgi:energy-coupling factor transporter ATP-binding protein EcfA2